MADKRISQLIERTDIANNDVLPIVASGATTTNKVTISTIQDWMQSNLDVGVTSVGLTMPSAFQVSGSPITTSGNINVTATGTASQYIRGDGSLADFPQGGGGGGASVSYYLNGSVSQGTIGGIAYLEMNKTPILGAGTDFTIAADGYIASFITDAGDPALLEIPAGNWNFETYLQASSGGGTPTFYIELYKVDSGGTATLIASNSGTPESISLGTNINPYFSALAVPQTTLLVTDRLALRYYVSHSGRTITLHTENNTLCQIITTFTTGLTALNGLTAQVQNFATGTSGTNFGISSSGSIHTFNLPDASASARGVVTTGTQTFAGEKTFSNTITVNTPANGLSTIYNGRSLDSANIIRFNNSGASSLQNFIQSTPTDLVIGSQGNTPIFFVTNNGGVGGGLRLTISGNGSILAQGSFEANSIRRTGGTSSQFLKADGSVDSSTYVTTDTNQSITGFKSFANGFSLASAGGTNQPSTFKNIGTLHEGTASINQIGFNSGNNIYFGKGLNNGGVITWNNAAVRYYALPDADGTLALTSNLSAYLPLTGGTLTGALNGTSASFSGGVSATSFNLGNGQFLRLTRTSGALQYDALGIVAGTDNTRLISTGDFDIVNASLTSYFKLASTGAATFSSSVTATGDIRSNAIYRDYQGEALIHTNGNDTQIGSFGAGTPRAISLIAGNARALFINTSGNVGIGTASPNNLLQVGGTTNGIIRIDGAGDNTDFGIKWSSSNASIYSNTGNAYLKFDTNGTERMRITSGGFLKASNTGSYGALGSSLHELNSNQSDTVLAIFNTASSITSQRAGIDVYYSSATPNNTTGAFYQGADNGGGSGRTLRFEVRSNGGIANYQANDVNLSDERTKKDIEPLESYWDKFKEIEIVKFKYKDQTHDDFNIGVIAQQVEAVAPEFVDVDGWDVKYEVDEESNEIVSEEEPLKSIYTADLYHASIKVLQEAMQKIEKLEAEVEALKSQING